MKVLFTAILIVFSSMAIAEDIKIIKRSKNSAGEKYIYLMASSTGNYSVKHEDFVRKKSSWENGLAPQLSISEAVERAKYFYKDVPDLSARNVSLSPASTNEPYVWYYLVTLAKLPFKFGQPEYEVVVLTSGEVVAPYKSK